MRAEGDGCTAAGRLLAPATWCAPRQQTGRMCTKGSRRQGAVERLAAAGLPPAVWLQEGAPAASAVAAATPAPASCVLQSASA